MSSRRVAPGPSLRPPLYNPALVHVEEPRRRGIGVAVADAKGHPAEALRDLVAAPLDGGEGPPQAPDLFFGGGGGAHGATHGCLFGPRQENFALQGV